MGDAWDRLKKDWELIKKKGFNTAEASADISIEEKKKDPTFVDKSEDFTKLSPMERAVLVRKGLLKEK